MPDFWYVRRKNFRHQRRLLYCRRGSVEAHQLPAACTFSSTVRASSWVPCTFSSAALARSQVLFAPFLQRCKPHIGFFGCLSYGHVKVLRNGFLKQHLGTAANLSSALPLRLYLHSLASFFFTYVVSFSISLFQLFIVHCTISLS